MLDDVSAGLPSPAPGTDEVALYEEIWRGERSGFSESALRESLVSAQDLLTGLRTGVVRPSAVVGSGIKRHAVRRVAESYLLDRIAVDEAALKSRGRSHPLNQSNVRFFSAVARRATDSRHDQQTGVRTS